MAYKIHKINKLLPQKPHLFWNQLKLKTETENLNETEKPKLLTATFH